MKAEAINTNINIRDYRHGDYDQISYLWESTEMGGHQRGDNEKHIEATIEMGGRLLIMESLPAGKINSKESVQIVIHAFGF